MKLAIKNILFTIFVPGTVVGWLPYWWYWRRAEFDPGAWRWVGFLLIAVGVAIYASTVWNFAKIGRGTPAPIDPPSNLVVRGLHRYVRNPMYVGVLFVLLGELVLFPSQAFAMYILVCFGIVNAFILLYEEPTLAEKFGEEYTEYRRRVPMWIPRLRPPDSDNS